MDLISTVLMAESSYSARTANAKLPSQKPVQNLRLRL